MSSLGFLFLLVTLLFVPLSSLTFPSVSVISYLAHSEATGMKTCLFDTWLPFPLIHGFCKFVCSCRFSSASLRSMRGNAVFPSHPVFTHMYFYVRESLLANSPTETWVERAGGASEALSFSCQPCCSRFEENRASSGQPSLPPPPPHPPPYCPPCHG